MWHQMPRGGLRPDARLPEARRRAQDLGRDDAVLDDPLLVIDVVDEQVERADALLQAALDAAPFRGRDDPRHDIERKDPLGAGAVAVDVEGDAHVQERALGGLLPAEELAVGQRFDELAERARRRPRLAVGVEHLIEEAAGFVVGEPHGNRAVWALTHAHGGVVQAQQYSSLYIRELAGNRGTRLSPNPTGMSESLAWDMYSQT